MPYRIESSSAGEVYHVFNRSIAKQSIFQSPRECQRFYDLLDFYRFDNPSDRFSHYNKLSPEAKQVFRLRLTKGNLLVEILAYAIMPNHFHLLVRSLHDNAISNYLRKVQNGYAKYLNLRSRRTGAVFQAMYKLVRMESDEQMLHVARYIHLNPVTGYILKDVSELSSHPWTSWRDYEGLNKSSFVETETIRSFYSSFASLREFTFDQADYQRGLAYQKHVLHDLEDQI